MQRETGRDEFPRARLTGNVQSGGRVPFFSHPLILLFCTGGADEVTFRHEQREPSAPMRNVSA